MNGYQTWYKNIFLKNCQVKGGVLAKFAKCNGPDELLNWCLRRICWVETILSLKISNVMSGDQAEVEKRKKHFFGLLTSCLV